MWKLEGEYFLTFPELCGACWRSWTADGGYETGTLLQSWEEPVATGATGSNRSPLIIKLWTELKQHFCCGQTHRVPSKGQRAQTCWIQSSTVFVKHFHLLCLCQRRHMFTFTLYIIQWFHTENPLAFLSFFFNISNTISGFVFICSSWFFFFYL